MKGSFVALFVACLAVGSESRDLRKKAQPENRYYLGDNNEVRTSVEIPAGGDRVLDITYELRKDKIEPLCLPAEYVYLYQRCEKEEPEPGCVVLKSCPSDCEAADGTRHGLSDAWSEGVNACRCSHPGSIYFEGMPPIPPGGEPYPPVNDCKLNGCRNYMSDTVMTEGDSFTRDDGSKCTCVPGTDRDLMDSYTLFHLQCQAPEIKIEEPTVKEEAIEPENTEPEDDTADTSDSTEPENTEPETAQPAEPEAPVETDDTTEEAATDDTTEEAATDDTTEEAEADEATEEAAAVEVSETPTENEKTTVERAAEDPILAQADAEIAAAMAEQAAVPNPQV